MAPVSLKKNSIAILLLIVSSPSAGLRLTPGDDLQAAIDTAQPQQIIYLSPGTYRGNFFVNQSVTLEGESGVVLDAEGRGDGLRVRAPHVVIRKLTIRNWGDDLTAMNAGIFVEKQAHHTRIEDNDLHGDVTGIWLEKTSHIDVLRNRVQGNLQLRSSDRGNGIHLNLVTDVEVRGNEVWHVRDGLYIISSQNNLLIDNYLHDLRYGVHYMYSHSNRVEDNLARRTRAGYALMQSRQLTVLNNRSEDSDDYGVLLNYITYSVLRGNRVSGVRQDPEKAVDGSQGKALFIYNSLYNTIAENEFSHSEIGIHLTAGSENNTLSGNSFMANPVQVKYVATRTQEWSKDGRGNYWSNYLGWDMNGDQRGDIAFEPNDGVDKILWQYPKVRVLMNSPGVLLLRWVQRQFPVLKSPGVKDSYPLMAAPTQFSDSAPGTGL